MNELAILACNYHFFLFTDFVPSPERKVEVGESLIAIATFVMAVNLLKAIYLVVVPVRRQFIKMQKKRQFVKR